MKKYPLSPFYLIHNEMRAPPLIICVCVCVGGAEMHGATRRVEIRAMNHGERMNLSTRRDAIEIVKEGEHKGGRRGRGRRINCCYFLCAVRAWYLLRVHKSGSDWRHSPVP